MLLLSLFMVKTKRDDRFVLAAIYTVVAWLMFVCGYLTDIIELLKTN